MKKRSVTEYQEPHTLDDLRRIVDDHGACPGQTRVWIRPAQDMDGDAFYTVCLSAPLDPGA